MRIENLDKATNCYDSNFTANLARLCERFGYDHASYAHINTDSGIISGYTTYPMRWISVYTKLGLHKRDPLILLGAKFKVPLYWSFFSNNVL